MTSVFVAKFDTRIYGVPSVVRLVKYALPGCCKRMGGKSQRGRREDKPNKESSYRDVSATAATVLGGIDKKRAGWLGNKPLPPGCCVNGVC